MKSLDRVLILGNGQLGRALYRSTPINKLSVAVWTKSDLDFLNPRAFTPKLKEYRPSLIINAAAYTSVDLAETDSETAMTINCIAPSRLAEYAEAASVPIVHFSSDYVYPGIGAQAQTENSAISPLNAYGRSKLAGDLAITRTNCQHLIFRTSWLYSEEEHNFFLTMLRLMREKTELKVVCDQIGAPTYCLDLAVHVWSAIHQALARTQFPTGVYHLCNTGFGSWYDFAQLILQHARSTNLSLAIRHLMPIKSEDYVTTALRPLNSRLDQTKIQREFGIVMPNWQTAVENCFSNWQKVTLHAAATTPP